MPSAPQVIDWFDGTDYDFLSNFYPARIPLARLVDLLDPRVKFNYHAPIMTNPTCGTVEEAFQAVKATSWDSFWAVLKDGYPGRAKTIGNKIPLRPDWDRCFTCGAEYRRSGQFHPLPDGDDPKPWDDHEHVTTAELVMKRCLDLKFETPVLRDRLLATGRAYLLEGNTWHDQTWGSCRCPDHGMKPGRNLLGRLLMDVREGLK